MGRAGAALTTGIGRIASAFTAEGVRRRLLAETERWILWLPVAFGVGVAVYFALPQEPPLALGCGAFAGAAALGTLARQRVGWLVLALGLAAASAGFVMVQTRATTLASPVLQQRIGPVETVGKVVEILHRVEGVRLLLDDVVIERLATSDTPARVRVTLRQGGREFRPGDIVALRAVLQPPPTPSMPGSYDFARDAWFQKIGAVGYAVGAPRLVPGGGVDGWTVAIQDLRHAITRRILAAIDGPSGAIAAALMTGDQLAIPKDLLAAWRDAGLAHMLSISGLHFVLVTGFVFVLVRRGLAAVPHVALRVDGKKIAAAVAILAAFAYLLISGASVPTQRSFLMTTAIMAAILLDRTAVTMRLVALAALALLLWSPESLLGASFQMSFAAVVALIAAYEAFAPKIAAWHRGEGGWWRVPLIYLSGVLLTTLVAGTATTPFAIYHFDRVATYSTVGNLLAMPICSFWVMPLAVFAFLAMPLGLEAYPLQAMALGIDAINAVARLVASWPGAAIAVKAMPVGGIVAVALGGLWLCLWQGGWRWFGVIGVVAGTLSFVATVPPDVLIDAEGRTLAVKAEGGGYRVSSPRAFPVSTWLGRAGEDTAKPWPRKGTSDDGRLRCDADGCLYRALGQVVGFPRTFKAVNEDCRNASAVLTALPIRGRCAAAQIVIDRDALWRSGAHALWLSESGISVKHVAAQRGDRPWSPARTGAQPRRPGRSGEVW
jgi:competence protein ComEC